MTARKVPYRSQIVDHDAPLLLPICRPIGGILKENSAVGANAASVVPLTVDNTSPLQSSVAAECKSNPTTPEHTFVRMEKAIMQSCWIQRLNPMCDTSTLGEEELEPNPVWTHFTKDFSSCSKRLHKARNHTRSSSWPPTERTTNCSPSLDLKLVKPVDIKEPFPLSKVFLSAFRKESSRVSLQDNAESNCFKAGNLIPGENSYHKSVEALVPCSHVARTFDDFHVNKSNDESKLRVSAAQNFYSKFNIESGSLLEVISTKVLGDAPCKGKLPVSEVAHKMPHARGSSPDAVIGTSLSPALMGASADADDRTRMSCPLIRSVHLPTPSILSTNRPAVGFGDTKNKVNKMKSGMVFDKHSGKVCRKEVKTKQNFGFFHVAGQSKKPTSSGANPFMGRGGPQSRICSDEVGACDKGAGSFTNSKPNEKTHDVGFDAFASNAGSFVYKELNNVDSSNKELRRSDPVVADHLCSPKKACDTKVPPARVPSGGFTRPSCKETSFDQYWVQLFEDSRPRKAFDTSYPEDNQQQECTTDGCSRFGFNSLTANGWKLDENEKHKSFQHPGAPIPHNNCAQIYTSCNVPLQTQALSGTNFMHTKWMGLGHNCTSVDRSPPKGTSISKAQQEERLQGGMIRLAPKMGKKDFVRDDGRIAEPSKNGAWIQRWQSSSNLVVMSEKPIFTLFGMDKEKGSAPEKCHASTSPKGVKDMDWVEHNLQESTRASKPQTEGSARHYNSGPGGTSRGVKKNHAKSKLIAPSVKAMALVGNTAGKLHITTLENRGSFSVWPSLSEENDQGKGQGKTQETVEDNMHGVEINDLGFLEPKWR